MHTILLVEDNLEFQKAIVTTLQSECIVSVVGSIAEAKSALEQTCYELILLDVGLPDGEGYKLCLYMKDDDRLKDVPVIFLTGRSEVEDKLLAFSIGAEDYIQKPFNGRELRARVLSRVARKKARQQTSTEFRRGDLRFCLASQRVYVLDQQNKEQSIQLTGIEFKLLLYFANHVDHVLSRDQILNSVWGDGIYISDRTIDSHISKLRKKILASRCKIVPVHGEGYRFVPSSQVEFKGQAA